MTPLVKAVYFLFLRHPEGIVFKNLMDYRTELQKIYEDIKGERLDDKKMQSIIDTTDPTKNSINEKCARIREAFVTRFDERLAVNYIIQGERGEAKRIPLHREFVEWACLANHVMPATPVTETKSCLYISRHTPLFGALVGFHCAG